MQDSGSSGSDRRELVCCYSFNLTIHLLSESHSLFSLSSSGGEGWGEEAFHCSRAPLVKQLLLQHTSSCGNFSLTIRNQRVGFSNSFIARPSLKANGRPTGVIISFSGSMPKARRMVA